MKKFIVWAAVLAVLSGCGVAGVSGAPASSAKSGDAYLAFTSSTKSDILVDVDGKQYQKATIRTDGQADTKSIKEMAGNVLVLTPGTHQIVVKSKNGQELYRKTISVSAQERKVINL